MAPLLALIFAVFTTGFVQASDKQPCYRLLLRSGGPLYPVSPEVIPPNVQNISRFQYDLILLEDDQVKGMIFARDTWKRVRPANFPFPEIPIHIDQAADQWPQIWQETKKGKSIFIVYEKKDISFVVIGPIELRIEEIDPSPDWLVHLPFFDEAKEAIYIEDAAELFLNLIDHVRYYKKHIFLHVIAEHPRAALIPYEMFETLYKQMPDTHLNLQDLGFTAADLANEAWWLWEGKNIQIYRYYSQPVAALVHPWYLRPPPKKSSRPAATITINSKAIISSWSKIIDGLAEDKVFGEELEYEKHRKIVGYFMSYQRWLHRRGAYYGLREEIKTEEEFLRLGGRYNGTAIHHEFYTIMRDEKVLAVYVPRKYAKRPCLYK
jgi:hypothetical protein